jgi:hypothetical protein
VIGTLCPIFETPIRGAAERHDNLKRSVARMAARCCPDLREIAGCQAAAWSMIPKSGHRFSEKIMLHQ